MPQASFLPEERNNHNMVLMPDGKILLVGGHDGMDIIKDTRMFDPNAASPEWKDMADMVKPRGNKGNKGAGIFICANKIPDPFIHLYPSLGE